MPAVIPFPTEPTPWFSLSASADGRRATLDIRGQIGAPEMLNDYGLEAAGTFGEFERAVRALGPDVREIEMNVYSPGGDVFTALAMHDLLVRHPARIHGRVDGLAASAATVVLLAADTIEIPENAYFMIHNPMSGVYGDYREIESLLGKMKRWTRDMANLYTARLEDAGKGTRAGLLDQVLSMMDAETYLTGAEAVEAGFADRTSARIDLAACAALTLRVHHPDRVPAELAALIDSPATATTTAAHEAPAPSIPNPTPILSMSAETLSPTEPAPDAGIDADPIEPTAPVAEAPAADPAAPASVVEPAPAAPAVDMVAQLGALLDAKLAPIQERLAAQEQEIGHLSALHAHGVDPQAWGNAPATGDSLREEPGAPEVVDFGSLSAEQKISAGVKAMQERLRTARRA